MLHERLIVAMMIKRLYSEIFLRRFDPERYAREAGVTIGTGCKLIRPNFGSEPWLIRIGNLVEVTGGGKIHYPRWSNLGFSGSGKVQKGSEIWNY